MAPQAVRLVVRSGPNPGKVFDLDRNEISIGRDISNEIVINDAEVSRRHARLVAQAGGYVIEDQGSTNGTFVNGQRLMGPHMLRPGELILLGENVSLAYETAGYEDAGATMVAASNVPSMPPSPRESYIPPQPAPSPQPVSVPPPPPAYSSSYSAGPAQSYEVQEEPPRSRTWLYVGCGCLIVVLCLLVAGAFAFDSLNLYCTPPFNTFFSCP